jgi:chromosomal replication initiation ATPase DnaA
MELIPSKPRPTVRSVLLAVARENDMTVAQLLSQRTGLRVTRIRQEAMYRAKIETGRSYAEIGRAFGMDHSTIIYGVRQHLARVSAGAQGSPLPGSLQQAL